MHASNTFFTHIITGRRRLFLVAQLSRMQALRISSQPSLSSDRRGEGRSRFTNLSNQSPSPIYHINRWSSNQWRSCRFQHLLALPIHNQLHVNCAEEEELVGQGREGRSNVLVRGATVETGKQGKRWRPV